MSEAENDHIPALRALWRDVAEKGIDFGVDYPRIVLALFGDLDDLRASVLAIHKPVAADERCDSETWSTDHYGDAVDPYWIRCTRVGRHGEHSDAGNTGCTWPISESELAVQEALPLICDADDEPWPCPTAQVCLPPGSEVGR